MSGLGRILDKLQCPKIDVFPLLSLVVDPHSPITVIPYWQEGKASDVWRPTDVHQLICVADAFERCVSCAISFEFVSPFESTGLGKYPSEAKRLLCEAIAARGSSPPAGTLSVAKSL
jgi:hypothetical protein